MLYRHKLSQGIDNFLLWEYNKGMENTQIPPSQYLPTLIASGLEPDQALVYEALLKLGPQKASKIAQKTPLKRGLTYKILDELVSAGLVTKVEPPKKVAIFEPSHPLKLKDLAEQKANKLKTAQLALDGIMGQLSSDFNLVSGKPGVQFYEGKDGVKKVLEDSLTCKNEIYSYADIESIDRYIPEINKDYVAKRERLKIKKRGIVLDTPFNRRFLTNYHKNITDTKLIKLDKPPFQTVMQIYDSKTSYITLAEKRMIGVIISDPHIYQMHKYLFEYLWSSVSV
jgi:HTH-type transcriptional regulator, sugar sensing transcriptional regulator